MKLPENEDNPNLLVDEMDLLAALDALDEFAPGTQQEDWYRRLSAAVDLHLKPKMAPPGTIIRH